LPVSAIPRENKLWTQPEAMASSAAHAADLRFDMNLWEKKNSDLNTIELVSRF
jgi:hypothetical protein